MALEEAFLRDVIGSPDDTPRRVYADWLEENGQPDRAEFIRTQCELAGLDDTDDRRWPLAARERQLLWLHGKHWVGPLRRLVRRWHFRRGFVEAVTLDAAAFIEHAKTLLEFAPIREVRLLAAPLSTIGEVPSPYLKRLTGLDLRFQQLGPTGFQTLALSKHLKGLRRLNLCGTGLCSNEGLRALAGCKTMPNLTALDLSQRRRGGRRAVIDAASMRAFAESPHFPKLTEFAFRGCGMSIEHGAREALVNSALLGRLQALDLSATFGQWGMPEPGQQEIDYEYDEERNPPFVQMLASSPQAAGLRRLRLCRIAPFYSPSYWALVDSRYLTNLTHLDLDDTLHSVVEALAAARSLKELRWLSLVGNWIEDKAVRRLAECKHWKHLRVLNLSENPVSARGVEALMHGAATKRLAVLGLSGLGAHHKHVAGAGAQAVARSAGAANLAVLDLGNQDVTDAGLKALAASKHLKKLTTLLLWRNKVGAAGVKALLASRSLPALSLVDLRGNPLPAKAPPALRQRFGYGVRYGPWKRLHSRYGRHALDDEDEDE
jgi:uncharacterized protein (TIGR02996 family)